MTADDPRFDAARAVILGGIEARAFPAAVVDVGRSDGAVWQQAFGRLTYDDDAPDCKLDTVFDLASLTKVISTATSAMRLVGAGAVALGDAVNDMFPGCGLGADRAITLRHLLDHSSGLPAHLRLWESANDRDEFRKRICATKLERQPGEASVYSDPGFMLAGFMLETVSGRSLDRMFLDVSGELPKPLLFRPPVDLVERIAPTEFDPWRGRLVRGEVHDENAWALGGVAAHAGLFGTAPAVAAFARLVLRTFNETTTLGTPDTMRLFATRTGIAGSSRALGWDTALPTSSCGRRMSATAIGHTGFTGTSLWIDRERDLYAVLLTNRVYPTRQNEKLLPLRARFHDALPL